PPRRPRTGRRAVAARAQRAAGRGRRLAGGARRAAGQRTPPRGHPPGDRACRPRHPLRAAVARHRCRARPRGVPRRHHHPPGRGRHRRPAVEQEPAALAQRRDRHPAGAGDPRRRGAGRARCDRRPARRQRAVLPARARRAPGRGAADADRRVLPRAAGRGGGRRGGRGPAGPPGRGPGGAVGMSAGSPVQPRPPAPAGARVDWARVRADFPLLRRTVHGKPLVYLDSANTGRKPAPVIEAVDAFYRRHNANVSRAVHALGTEATEAYEAARTALAGLVNVRGDELVLCSGTTFAINLVAYSWALPRLKAGDVILVTRMEHHANIVPWQLVAERTGAVVRPVDPTPDGALDLDALYRAMTPEVKLLA